MRSFLVILILAALGAGIYFKRDKLKALLPGHHAEAQADAQAAPPAGSPPAGGSKATDTIQAAAAAAHAEGRTLLYHFSLENCGPCKLLDQNVLSTSQWQTYVGQKFKVIDVLFPSSFTSENTQMVQAIGLKEHFEKATGAGQAFPMLAAVDANGRVLGGVAGYNHDGLSFYLSWVEKMHGMDKAAPAKPAVPTASTGSNNAAVPTKPTVATASPAAQPAPVAAPAPKPVVAAPAPAPVPTVKSKPASEFPFRVRGIVGGAHPTATVYSGVRAYTIEAGDTLNMQTASGAVRVKCVSISMDTVVLLVGDDPVRVEIQL